MKPKTKRQILITAPSLDENVNVSGISTVVRQIIARGTGDYRHFLAGRGDGEPQNLVWALRQPLALLRLYNELRRARPDVFHLNTALNPLSIMRDSALAAVARARGVPVLLHLHGGKYLAREFENGALRAVAVKMLDAADRIVVLSRLEQEILARRFPHLQADVLENAVAADEFPPAAKEPRSILFLGRLHESKGLAEIVEAVRILRAENVDFKLRAFGAGPEEAFFVREMRALLGEKFHFGGVVAGAAKRAEFARADVFLLPSRYGEGLPMALLEAMAARCVVVAAEMASVGAVVADGRNGYLVPPGDAAALTGKLKEILAGGRDFAAMRENAHRTVREQFDLAGYIRKLEGIYEEMIEKGEAGASNPS